MRTIKFRGKRTDTKDWVYGDYFKTPLTDENSGLPPESGWYFLTGGEQRHCIGQDGVAFTVIPETVGQLTGMKDRNDMDVYEGDIIQFKSEKRYRKWDHDWDAWEVSTGHGKVFWWHGDFMLDGLYTYEHLSRALEFGGVLIRKNSGSGGEYEERYSEFEVVGNVYDDKDLLK